MSDEVVAKGGVDSGKFAPHSAGSGFVGQCVDVIAMGERVQDFPDKPAYLAQGCALVFITGERNEITHEFVTVSREFTVSLGPKSNLGAFLTSWLGKPLTEVQIRDGVPLHKLEGFYGLLTISHRVSAKKRTYANILSISPVPKQMQGGLEDYRVVYSRDAYWNVKKAEYAAEAARFRSDAGAPATDDDHAPLDEDDNSGLPF